MMMKRTDGEIFISVKDYRRRGLFQIFLESCRQVFFENYNGDVFMVDKKINELLSILERDPGERENADVIISSLNFEQIKNFESEARKKIKISNYGSGELAFEDGSILFIDGLNISEGTIKKSHRINFKATRIENVPGIQFFEVEGLSKDKIVHVYKEWTTDFSEVVVELNDTELATSMSFLTDLKLNFTNPKVRNMVNNFVRSIISETKR